MKVRDRTENRLHAYLSLDWLFPGFFTGLALVLDSEPWICEPGFLSPEFANPFD